MITSLTIKKQIKIVAGVPSHNRLAQKQKAIKQNKRACLYHRHLYSSGTSELKPARPLHPTYIKPYYKYKVKKVLLVNGLQSSFTQRIYNPVLLKTATLFTFILNTLQMLPCFSCSIYHNSSFPTRNIVYLPFTILYLNQALMFLYRSSFTTALQHIPTLFQ